METRNVFVVNRCVVGSNYAIKRDLRENTGFKSIIGRVGPLFWFLGVSQTLGKSMSELPLRLCIPDDPATFRNRLDANI